MLASRMPCGAASAVDAIPSVITSNDNRLSALLAMGFISLFIR
jgi:hypothetical protein